MLKKIALGISAMLLATGCTYKASNARLNLNLANVDMAKIEKMKRGEACVSYFLGIIPLSTDATIRKAAQEAGIKTVEYVENTSSFYLIYSDRCVVVYGE